MTADRAPISAVVVDYCSGALLRECAESLLREGAANLVVVDNAPAGAAELSSEAVLRDLDAPPGWLLVVGTARNVGYGAGANLGVSRTTSEQVLVCNPDVVLHHGALDRLASCLDADPARAITGPRMLTPAGELYPSARRFPNLVDAAGHGFVGLVLPRNRWTRRYTMGEWDHAVRADVDWVSGACFLVRRSAWETLAGFDEDYFMYAEDVDLCWRARRLGWKVAYEPAATVTHVQGCSTQRHPWRMLVSHHRSLFRFAVRSSRGWERALLPVVAAGLVVRTAAASARRACAGSAAPTRVSAEMSHPASETR